MQIGWVSAVLISVHIAMWKAFEKSHILDHITQDVWSHPLQISVKINDSMVANFGWLLAEVDAEALLGTF